MLTRLTMAAGDMTIINFLVIITVMITILILIIIVTNIIIIVNNIYIIIAFIIYIIISSSWRVVMHVRVIFMQPSLWQAICRLITNNYTIGQICIASVV